MRVVQLNLAADFTLPSGIDLLDQYHTLTGWAQALQAAGAQVHVVQRFRAESTLARDGITYELVADDHAPMLAPWSVSMPCVAAVERQSPDVVHVNGLMFPGMTSVLRARLGAKCVLVLQDHSGVVPKLPIFQRSRHQHAWAASFRAADACTFTARELASRWHPVGLPPDGRVLEIPEASTTFRPIERAEARRRTGLSGEPAILWVGRVDTNKDPSMVLAAFAQSSGSLPGARLWMIVPSARDRAALEPLTAAAAPADRARIHVIGPRAYDEMPHYYSSADMLISASHHEGSGYAVIEAMACGATPCVTDIPPFRALTGNIGMLWPVGDVAACRQALERAAALVSARQRQSVRNHFDEQLSWRMIGRRTYDAYASLRR